MDTKEILTLVSIIVAAVVGLIGFGLTIIQICKAKKVKEMELVASLISAIRTNEKLSAAFYQIEYDEEWYNDGFHGNEDERRMDALLSQLDYLCYARKKGLIGKAVFDYFEYTLQRVVNNKCVRNYLWNLYHFSNATHTKSPLADLTEYMKKGLTKEGQDLFEDSKSPYKKYLNFD